jgi:hypothetical protein
MVEWRLSGLGWLQWATSCSPYLAPHLLANYPVKEAQLCGIVITNVGLGLDYGLLLVCLR